MFAHLVPASTPGILMPFMVCIETISNLIRPISVSVRLAANMMTGHLLLSMLENYIVNTSNFIFPIMMTIEVFLIMYEVAVAIIQAYAYFPYL